jgi:hypothetical protein
MSYDTIEGKSKSNWPHNAGPEYFMLLKQGYKIELEAVVSSLGTAVPIVSLATIFRSS